MGFLADPTSIRTRLASEKMGQSHKKTAILIGFHPVTISEKSRNQEDRWKRDSDRPHTPPPPPISTMATTGQKKIKLDSSNSKTLKSSTFKSLVVICRIKQFLLQVRKKTPIHTNLKVVSNTCLLLDIPVIAFSLLVTLFLSLCNSLNIVYYNLEKSMSNTELPNIKTGFQYTGLDQNISISLFWFFRNIFHQHISFETVTLVRNIIFQKETQFLEE